MKAADALPALCQQVDQFLKDEGFPKKSTTCQVTQPNYDRRHGIRRNFPTSSRPLRPFSAPLPRPIHLKNPGDVLGDSVPRTPPPPRRNPFRWRPDQQWEAYLFILPSLLGFLIFVFLAVGTSFGISFLDWGLTGPRGFVAANNYRQLLPRSGILDGVPRHHVLFLAIVPLQLALGLAMAVALNQAIHAQEAFRLVYFLPVVTTIVAGTIVFRLILSRTGPLAGLVSGFGDLVGLPLALPDLLGGAPSRSGRSSS